MESSHWDVSDGRVESIFLNEGGMVGAGGKKAACDQTWPDISQLNRVGLVLILNYNIDNCTGYQWIGGFVII